MRNNVTIHMGASRFDVTVRAANGTPITFDLNKMTREEKKTFHREFMKAYRSSVK